ncbi:MAG: ABC transporter permease [Nitrospirae bacterium]|nr:ABC transporter permease [Nitrospirota bacterium]
MKFVRLAKVSLRASAKNRLRTFFMMLGVIIGIATLTVIVSLSLGAREEVMKKVNKFGLDEIAISPGAGKVLGVPGESPTVTLTIYDAEAILNELKNIKMVAPAFNMRNVTVKYGELNATTMVAGVTVAWTDVWEWNVTAGEFLSDDDVANNSRVVLLGKTVADQLFGKTDPEGETITIKNLSFKVKGVLESKGTSPAGSDMDDRVVIPLSTAQKRLANKEYLSQIKVKLTDYNKMAGTVLNIKALLRERHHLNAQDTDDFSIITPTEAEKVATTVSTAFMLFLAGVSLISLIVGGITIMNIMLISVNERRQEIGLRRAVGATRGDIMSQFLCEALFATVAGGLCGVIAGFGISKILSMSGHFPVVITWVPFAAGSIFSIVIGMVFGIQPARKAAALEPVEAMRG